MFLKNAAGQYVTAQMISKTDGSDVTTGTTTVYRTDYAGSPNQTSVGTAVHMGQGTWAFAPSQEDSNRDHLSLTFVNTNAVSVNVNIYPTALADIVLAGIKADLAGITGESRRSILNALRKLLNKWTLSGTTFTAYKEDDSTQAFTETVTPAAGADSIVGSDPN